MTDDPAFKVLMANADNANLDDMKDIERAMIEARRALIKAMAGLRGERETFLFHLGFARGRIGRLYDRVYGGREGEDLPDAP